VTSMTPSSNATNNAAARSNDRYYTTGTIARLLSVAPRTVSKWIDSGMLKGFRVPLSRDRRVTRESLVKFCNEYQLPLRDLERAA
jgi:two-component system response regulator RpaA